MEQDDRTEAQVCAACGNAVISDAERTFEFGDENILCWECATARGGRYDEQRDAWERPPDLAGIADEAYGATPGERRRHR